MEEKERREIISKFVSQNQGCTFDQIAQGVKDEISRMPAYDTVTDLVDDGILKDKKVNRRDHRYFVETNNPVTVTSRELDEFESVLISLLKKVKEHINRRYDDLKTRHYSDPEPSAIDEANRHQFRRALRGEDRRALAEIDEFFYATDLISTSFRIFSEILKTYMLRSTILWPKIIKDKDFLNMLISTVFAKFSDIRIHMQETFGLIKTPKGHVSLDDSSYDPMVATTNLRESFEKKLNHLDMKKESEQVLTFICNFTGKEIIRQAEYARTSNYMWDITQIDSEFINKTIEGTYETLEDYENPFLKYKIGQ
ncbi:MAG TPA: hypothetical protein VJ729_07275 [Nitrososphaeraceae archaeon]|nr:hypothetical protein [Nitrososphaeraceae archaeon]